MRTSSSLTSATRKDGPRSCRLSSMTLAGDRDRDVGPGYGAHERDHGLTEAGEEAIEQLWTPASPITLVDVSQAVTPNAQTVIREARKQGLSGTTRRSVMTWFETKRTLRGGPRRKTSGVRSCGTATGSRCATCGRGIRTGRSSDGRGPDTRCIGSGTRRHDVTGSWASGVRASPQSRCCGAVARRSRDLNRGRPWAWHADVGRGPGGVVTVGVGE